MLKYIFDSIAGRNLIFLLCILVFRIGAMAQDAQSSPEPACAELGTLSDFAIVAETKGRLEKELPELDAKAKDLEKSKIPQAEKSEKDLIETNTQIEQLRTQPSSESNQQKLRDLEKFKTALEGVLIGNSVERLNKELQSVIDDISWQRAQLTCVNASFRKLIGTPEQAFKREMSFYFAVLIGFVIVGFFVMAFRDDIVRRAIFSGQTGLQFVTLFSIVIAIILFGITGILEAKELAALLGGLSGYILGRSSAPPGGQAGAGSSQNNGGGGTVPTDVSGVASVAIAPITAALTVTTPTQQLSATATDAKSNPVTGLPNYVFQWFCDDPSVATVDQAGLVTWVGPGTCSVTVTANGSVSNACVVTCR